MHKRILCLWLALCLLMGFAAGCGKDDGAGGGFRFPIDAEPSALDPQMATDDAAVTVLCALFEGLTRLDEHGKPIPAAADWTVSEDGLTYTFTLRESYWNTNPVKGKEQPWDENLPVTADDFLFAFRRLADPAIASPLAGELLGIQNADKVLAGQTPIDQLGVKAVDSSTLTVTLTAPDDDFLVKMATSPFFPCHRAFFEATAGRYGLEEQYLLSNGAFRLTAWNHNESLLLYKHEQYHDATDVLPEAVRFVIGGDDPVAALQSGNLSAAPLSAEQVRVGGKDLRTTALNDTVRGVWFNTSADPLAEVHLRRALREGIAWESVDALLQQQGETIAGGYVPPAATTDGEVYRRAENALPRATDTAAATKHLQTALQALYPDQSATPSRIKLTLLAAEDPLSADIARYILQSWQKHLGITVKLELVSETELARRVKNGNYQAALYTHTPSGLTGAENLSAFASTATDNVARLVDNTVDAAIAAAKGGGRAETEALEQAVFAACPAIPIGFPCRYYGFAANVADVVVRPFGGGRYQAPLDFRKAKQYD